MGGNRESPSQSEVEIAFGEAMAAAGFNPGPIEADTADFVRFDAPGDKPGKRNGYYKLVGGGHPIGWFGDWKQGDRHEWKWDFGRKLTRVERDRVAEERRRSKIEAEKVRAEKHAERAADARAMWAQAEPKSDRIAISRPRHRQRRTEAADRDGRHGAAAGADAVLRRRGRGAALQLQFIDPAGAKRFMKAARIDGAFFPIGDPGGEGPGKEGGRSSARASRPDIRSMRRAAAGVRRPSPCYDARPASSACSPNFRQMAPNRANCTTLARSSRPQAPAPNRAPIIEIVVKSCRFLTKPSRHRSLWVQSG